jgi:hypothetical protein
VRPSRAFGSLEKGAGLAAESAGFRIDGGHRLIAVSANEIGGREPQVATSAGAARPDSETVVHREDGTVDTRYYAFGLHSLVTDQRPV